MTGIDPTAGRRRVLFFAEAVTLAHVARPIVLARALAGTAWQPVMACDARYRRFFETEPWPTLPLTTIPGAQFLRALAKGSPVYSADTLRGYLAEDLRLIDQVRPDVVVGDFRLSLSVAARLARVPYIAISNAYWSPYVRDKRFPMPVLPISRMLPLPLAGALFRVAQPVAFAQHCAPLNRLRRENGLPSLGADLRRVYTDADRTLYADLPEAFEMEAPMPAHHRFIGPIVWSPPVPLPSWWHEVPTDRPIVYVTLGSSGSSRTLDAVLQALGDLPLSMLVATAGAPRPARTARNAFIADYLPGEAAAERARLVICNGGSPTSQQALAAGVPVLGIASNMDQFLNMQGIGRLGAGKVLRADRIDAEQLRRVVSSWVEAESADRPRSTQHGSPDAAAEFADVLREIGGFRAIETQMKKAPSGDGA
ncbi:MAG TPA: glycosyltransferase [Burkholderiaceae bacterium]|nr:glycosyltransferase [Burkholderiaceae bacterium]